MLLHTPSTLSGSPHTGTVGAPSGGFHDRLPAAHSRKLKVLDLFSGIGGFSLGLESTGGFETVAFCELEEFPRKVLAKHWPVVPCYHDVRELTAERLFADGIAVDVICGGFPCQGVSIAGKGRGFDDPRSALWWEFHRIIQEVRPKLAIIENSPKLRSRGLHSILIALNAIGYDAEWHCIPASHVGAPHRRDRIWIIAYRESDPFSPDADLLGPHSPSLHLYRSAELRDEQECDFGPLGWWRSEPRLDRMVDGLPYRMDVNRTKAIGGAVVPQIPEIIGRAILASLSHSIDHPRSDGPDCLASVAGGSGSFHTPEVVHG